MVAVILIGDGAHGRDIASTGSYEVVRHHLDWDGRSLPVVIGINDPRRRSQVAFWLGVQDEAWIHPEAWVGPGCVIGPGTHVNYRVSMIRTIVGKHCTISPGATICGDVLIGDRVLIGAGATVCDRVTIHHGATVGAGAVVLPESVIPEGKTWVGVPAHG